jgi:hypothetical protein
MGNAVHFSLVKTPIICNSEWKRVYRLLSQNICVLCYIIVEPNSSLEIFTQSFHMSFGESRKCNRSSCTNNSLLNTNFYVKYEYMCILLSCRFFNVVSKSDKQPHCCSLLLFYPPSDNNILPFGGFAYFLAAVFCYDVSCAFLLCMLLNSVNNSFFESFENFSKPFLMHLQRNESKHKAGIIK